jgi:integration host factor subunit alpha|tara:strand:+ start:665 stop:955 length:291 start_codon:yes stop_codon:yes gene_type:complete
MKRDNLSKIYLLRKIQKELGIPGSISKKILDNFFHIIAEGLVEDGKVKISGFGTFKILDKKQRIGRNPKTQIEYKVSARKVVTFNISQEIKKKINS